MIADSSSKVARRLAFFGDLGTHFAFSPKVAEGRMPLQQRAILARLAWLGYVCVYMAGFLLRCRISSIPSPQMGSAAIGARGEVRGSIAANSFRCFIEGPSTALHELGLPECFGGERDSSRRVLSAGDQSNAH